jgi:hypothetical protein
MISARAGGNYGVRVARGGQNSATSKARAVRREVINANTNFEVNFLNNHTRTLVQAMQARYRCSSTRLEMR